MSPMSPRLLRPRASGGFSPRSISGLAGWWDFSDSSAANMTTSGGSPNAISFIADKSGNERPLSQPDGSLRPALVESAIGGRSACNHNLGLRLQTATAFPSSTAISVFAVAQRSNWGSGFRGIGGCGYSANSGLMFFGFIQSGYVGNSVSGDMQLVGNGYLTGADRPPIAYGSMSPTLGSGPALLSGVLASSGSGLWANGTSIARVALSGNTNYAGALVLGAVTTGGGDPSDATIGEFLVYTSAVSQSDRHRIEGYLAWKWGLQSQLPYNHPYAASFPGFGSQTMPTDADALTYLAAVATADGGTGVEVGVANAVDAFVKGCKADASGVTGKSNWDQIKASCLLSGARTLSGALVPLAGAAPTNVNFVSGDYNRKTGLVGNGTSKRLDSNRSNSVDPKDSRHMAVYASQRSGTSCVYVSTTTLNTNGDSYLYQVNNGTVNSAKLSSGGVPSNASGTNLTTGLYGASRASSSAITIRRAGANVTQNVNSTTPLNENLLVYGVTSLYADARLAFYSVGESLDLALLDTRVSALYTAIGAAIP